MSRRLPLCDGQKSRRSTARAYGAARDCQRCVAGGSISGATSFLDVKLALEIDVVPLDRQGYTNEIAGTRLFLVSNDGGLITSMAGLTDTGYAVLVGQQD